MANGIKWGEDLQRDCKELKKLEAWGIYRQGWHDDNCPLHNQENTDAKEQANGNS